MDNRGLTFPSLSNLGTGFQLLTILPVPTVTKQEVEDHFSSHGAGTIKEIKLMNGFGFIEYEDMMDARDVVPGQSAMSNFVRGMLTGTPAFRMCFCHQLAPFWLLTSFSQMDPNSKEND